MTLVLLAVLLPSVLAAAEECSFVLWAEDSWLQTGKDSVSWTLIQTESSLAQCEAALGAKVNSQAEAHRKSDSGGKVEINGNVVSSNYVAKDNKFFSFHSTRYVCVPDKIDPRPKNR